MFPIFFEWSRVAYLTPSYSPIPYPPPIPPLVCSVFVFMFIEESTTIHGIFPGIPPRSIYGVFPGAISV